MKTYIKTMRIELSDEGNYIDIELDDDDDFVVTIQRDGHTQMINASCHELEKIAEIARAIDAEG